MAQDSLSTGENLQKRGVLQNTVCHRCGAEQSIIHAIGEAFAVLMLWAKKKAVVMWARIVKILDICQLRMISIIIILLCSSSNKKKNGIIIKLRP